MIKKEKIVHLDYLKYCVVIFKVGFLGIFWFLSIWGLQFALSTTYIEVISDSILINSFYLQFIYIYLGLWLYILICTTLKFILAQGWDLSLPRVLNGILICSKLLFLPIVTINIKTLYTLYSQQQLYVFNKSYCVLFRKNSSLFEELVLYKRPDIYQNCLTYNLDVASFFNSETTYAKSLELLSNLDFSIFEKVEKASCTNGGNNNVIHILTYGIKSFASVVGEHPYISAVLGLGLSTLCLILIGKNLGYTLSLSENQAELTSVSKQVLSLATKNDIHSKLTSENFASILIAVRKLEKGLCATTIKASDNALKIDEIRVTVQKIIDHLNAIVKEETSS